MKYVLCCLAWVINVMYSRLPLPDARACVKTLSLRGDFVYRISTRTRMFLHGGDFFFRNGAINHSILLQCSHRATTRSIAAQDRTAQTSIYLDLPGTRRGGAAACCQNQSEKRQKYCK